MALKAYSKVCEDADDGGGERKTRRDGATSPQKGGAHAGAPKGTDGNGATLDGTGSERPAPSRSDGGERTIVTAVGGKETGSQRREDQTILAQIGAPNDHPDLGQFGPVALWDQH